MKEYLTRKKQAGIIEERSRSSKTSPMPTWFGRSPDILNYLRKHVLPKMRKQSIIIHDIGVGEKSMLGVPSEPYELYNLAESADKKAKIFAVDVSGKALKDAEAMKEIRFIPTAASTVEKKYFNGFFPTQPRTRRKMTVTGGLNKKLVISVKIPGRAKKAIKFIRADIVTSTPANRADLVFCTSLIGHYPHMTGHLILRNISSAMRKGGYLVTDVSATHCYPERAGFKLIAYTKRDHGAIYRKVR